MMSHDKNKFYEIFTLYKNLDYPHRLQYFKYADARQIITNFTVNQIHFLVSVLAVYKIV